MQETPSTEEPEQQPAAQPPEPALGPGKNPLMLPAGGMGWGKKLLIGGAVLVALVLIAAGAYWTIHGRSTSNKSSNAPVTYGGPQTDPNALPPSSPDNSIDNASLDQDLTSVNAGISESSKSQTAANNALDDKSSEIDVPTN
ncbi:MAG TPA: hypothetical protein VF466_04940 [Candidatus Saccharimonadales bacterium]